MTIYKIEIALAGTVRTFEVDHAEFNDACKYGTVKAKQLGGTVLSVREEIKPVRFGDEAKCAAGLCQAWVKCKGAA